jgi:uncharacterized protein (TIGR02996 family)
MSPDEASRLRAVLAAPDADEPRLAYADYLAQSSRSSDQARAEFIRVQIDLARLPDNDPRWPTLIGRERELLGRYRAGWERPLRDRFKPPLASPGRWLRTQLFGNGGRWGFRRGFVEHILAAAPTFLAEDAAVLAYAPIRRVVLAHASERISPLAADRRLDQLASLHLVGDMELDEDLNVLTAEARAAGMRVLEFRLPRLWPDVEDLFETLRASGGNGRAPDPEGHTAWSVADQEARRRLVDLATSPRAALLTEDPAHEGELLALNEWVYLGDALTSAGAWAVAKGHQDLEDEDGLCRRLVLLRDGRGDELRESRYCHGEPL